MSTAIAGRQNQVAAVSLSGIPANVAAYFQVQVRDSLFASADLAMEGKSYFGKSAIFTVVPNPGPTGNSIINKSAPALSTWANGTYNLGASGWGSIEVGTLPIPEPSTFALAGLGAAAMLIFRRRK